METRETRKLFGTDKGDFEWVRNCTEKLALAMLTMEQSSDSPPVEDFCLCPDCRDKFLEGCVSIAIAMHDATIRALHSEYLERANPKQKTQDDKKAN